jgi:hypothetical protein
MMRIALRKEHRLVTVGRILIETLAKKARDVCVLVTIGAGMGLAQVISDI